MGGKMDEKIKTAIKNVARNRMEKKYAEDSEFCKAKFDARYGAEWNVSSKNESEQKKHIINTMMYDDIKRLRYHVENNFGLGVAFRLESYLPEKEMLENFFDFYLEYVLDEEKGLLCDAKGKKSPNQHVVQCIKKNIIKYGYENYYDYVIDYRNRLIKKDLKNKFIDNKRMGALYLGIGRSDITKIGNEGWSTKEIWLEGINYIDKYFENLTESLKEQMEHSDDIDFYGNYLMGKMELEWLLILCDHALGRVGVRNEFVSSLEKQFREAFVYAEKVVGKYEKLIGDNLKPDIFKDYAILYYIEIAENENRIMRDLLKYLYEVTSKDTRKRYGEITAGIIDEEKYMKTALFIERGVRYDSQKLNEKMEFAYEFGVALNEAMYCEYPLDRAINLVAFVEEIYNYDRIVKIPYAKNGKEYNMVSMAHNLVKGKYEKYNNRGEEIIILNEKVKRGIDCRIWGKDHYLLKNKLYSSIYDVEHKIFEKRKEDKKFIYLLPFYWYEVLNFLNKGTAWSE